VSQLLVAQRALTVPGWAKDALWRRAQAIPSLDLRFADSKSLVDATTGSNLVTFTRASSGTFVGSDGVIRTAVTNLLVRSEEFDNASWSKSAGGVALSPVVTQNQALAPNGTNTAELVVFDLNGGTAGVDFSILSQTLTTVTGLPYVFSVWARTSDGTSKSVQFTFNGDVPNNAAYGGAVQTVTSDWQRIVIGINSASNTSRFPRIALRGGTGSSATASLYLWGAQLEQSSSVGEYIPTTSTINSAPRFDHNPTTGESLGLLVEEQRTNLLVRSEEFDEASWTKVASSTIATNQTAAPDGTLTADLLTSAAATLFSGAVRQSPTVVSGTAYTLSAFFKKNNWRYVGLRLNTGVNGATERVPFYDFDTDTLSNGGVTGATITRVLLPNGWVRIALTFTTTTTTGTSDIWLTDSVGATQPVKAGTESVFIWGAQLE
jgi:hypothetical protein